MKLVIVDLFDDGTSYFCTDKEITDLLVKNHLQSIYEELYKLEIYRHGLFSNYFNSYICFQIRDIPIYD